MEYNKQKVLTMVCWIQNICEPLLTLPPLHCGHVLQVAGTETEKKMFKQHFCLVQALSSQLKTLMILQVVLLAHIVCTLAQHQFSL